MNGSLVLNYRRITLKQTKSTKQKSNISKSVLAEDKLRDKYVYNPDKKYYFVSVGYNKESPKWIRSPFLTEDEVREFLIKYSLNDSDTYWDLQIYNESLLREKIGVLNHQDEYVDLNLRYFIFDDRYSSDCDYYSEILSGKEHMSWKEGYSNWSKTNNVKH